MILENGVSNMPMIQTQTQTKKLALSIEMRQSLDCLQFSALDLNQYVQELSLSNPLLDVEIPDLDDASLSKTDNTVRFGEWNTWHANRRSLDEQRSIEDFCCSEESFADYLNAQLGQMHLLDETALKCCRYLVGCLNGRGYLDCPLELLAHESGFTLFELEQALFVIQMLDPPGVGARDLSECLILQLLRGKDFNEHTIRIATDGLLLLSKEDYEGLSTLLCTSKQKTMAAADVIRKLNPIPSQGFPDGEVPAFQIPDALIRSEDGRLTVQLNERILPKLSVNREYADLLNQSVGADVQLYVKQRIRDVDMVVRSVQERKDTLMRLLACVIEDQQDFFLRGGDMKPVTMQQTAQRMNISVSTVSRAVQNKYIQFKNTIIPLRDMFTLAICSDGIKSYSAQTIKKYIGKLIESEVPSAPLSDEAIRLILSRMGISISRRAIDKYRHAMGIPAAGRRRA